MAEAAFVESSVEIVLGVVTAIAAVFTVAIVVEAVVDALTRRRRDWRETASNLMVGIPSQVLVMTVVGGVVIALFFAQSPLIRRSLYPYTILLQTVPIVAIAPLILMWFGSGLRSVMLVAFVICLFPIIANTTQGLISVPRNLIDLFIMSNASRSRLLLKLRLPHALPHLFVGLRISAGISVIGAVTGELFASSNAVGEGGLGYSITYANSQLQTDYLFALVLTASLLGFLFFFTVTALEWLCLRKWHESAMKIDAD
jgi:NitT/TauT family transport system permease protein